MGNVNLEIFTCVFTGLMAIFSVPLSHGYTDDRDVMNTENICPSNLRVFAINNLYVALGSPPLPGWIPNGGDPCLEDWQGVQCVISNITGIVLNGANLGGQLGDKLDSFSSIITIDLSNNHIGGSIPSNLPPTLSRFFLSANQFIGSIPNSLSTLILLSDMSLNENLLTGEIPDAFQALTGLINLDLSSNNLSGQLPPSMDSLSSLTTLHVQNNQLSGILDVLQDLPLNDLNIANNLFYGPVPEKMLSIPNFQKDGNPFNIVPSPPPPSPPPPPQSDTPPGIMENGPSIQNGPSPVGSRKFLTTKRIVWIAIAGVLSSIILVIVLILLISKFHERKPREAHKVAGRQEIGVFKDPKEKPKNNSSSIQIQPSNEMIKVPKEVVHKQKEDHEIDMTGNEVMLLPPPPPDEKVIVEPIVLTEKRTERPPPNFLSPSDSATSFTIASLQQYTNSFAQENLIGGGMLGRVYRAELPDGKLLAVKKLDKTSSILQTDEAFLELVSSISKLRHANVVEFVGYCAEHGQRLLVHEYCGNGTLHDALYSSHEPSKKLPWNARIRMALGAARALEYLHEVCQPLVVHRNFKSANVLLDDEFAVRVSDCGLAELISSRSVSQLSGHIHALLDGAPEFTDSGIYTYQSDVYSFGIVMLELLTGRKSYDASRPRGEQSLVRWAIPQLHDIDLLTRMVDPSLNGVYPAKSISRFADIISLCVQSEPEFRPPMSEIVQNLIVMMQREPPSNRSDGEL